MSTHEVMTLTGQGGTLTTNHSASSYGQPVLVVDGVAYGPGDMIGRETPLVSDYKGVLRPGPRVIDLAATLSAPPEPALITAWNRSVVAAHTAGKHWSDEAGRYVVGDDPNAT